MMISITKRCRDKEESKENTQPETSHTGSPKCLLHYHYANTSGECPNPLFAMPVYPSRKMGTIKMNEFKIKHFNTLELVLFCCTFICVFFSRAWATQVFVGEECSDEIAVEFSEELVDDDNENRLNEWLAIPIQRELACDALKGYQNRQRKSIRALVGTAVVSVPAFTFAMFITMSSDGSTEPILNENWIVGSMGVAVVNALVWIPVFLKNKISKSDAERKMIQKYHNFKGVTLLINDEVSIPPLITIEF